MPEFISEDDLDTFEGWLRYQGYDAAALTPDELAEWRGMFDEVRKRSSATAKVGLMKLQPVPGEHRYAVAVREDADLWLALWVRRSRKGEFFVMVRQGPRLGRSHKLSPRRHAAHEELWPQSSVEKNSAIDGHISGNRAPRGASWVWSETRRRDLRSGRLHWRCRSCARCIGAARWQCCSGPRRARLRAPILA